jgi:hypothetical protein
VLLVGWLVGGGNSFNAVVWYLLSVAKELFMFVLFVFRLLLLASIDRVKLFIMTCYYPSQVRVSSTDHFRSIRTISNHITDNKTKLLEHETTKARSKSTDKQKRRGEHNNSNNTNTNTNTTHTYIKQTAPVRTFIFISYYGTSTGIT